MKSMTSIVSRRTFGFVGRQLHQKKEPHALYFLSQRSSFWIATLSVLAFLVGNMVGQNGWYLFWASVLGQADDSAIVYTGTVAPVAQVPDYKAWALYGGGSDDHTFRQVPASVLVSLPPYDQRSMKATRDASTTASTYSVGNMGSYATGAEGSGSHPGVDIRVPEGTPVLAIANGIVIAVKWDSGYGNVVVLRHPNVPDPEDPTRITTLFSSYAHLSAGLVNVGDTVQKGKEIARSGSTGLASGPHLHFQIDRDEAPWHPYWPFSTSEMRAAGLTIVQAVDAALHQERLVAYTVNPMLYVQANYKAVPAESTTIANTAADRRAERLAQARARGDSVVAIATSKPVVASEIVVLQEPQPVPLTGEQRRQQRLQERLARLRRTTVSQKVSEPVVSAEPVVQRDTVVDSAQEVPATPSNDDVTVELSHDGSFTGRAWEVLRVRLKDSRGNLLTAPHLSGDLYLRTAFGEAEFRPAQLTTLDFKNGIAEVGMLPRGTRTVVVEVQPYGTLSRPMVYE